MNILSPRCTQTSFVLATLINPGKIIPFCVQEPQYQRATIIAFSSYWHTRRTHRPKGNQIAHADTLPTAAQTAPSFRPIARTTRDPA